jgi:type III secretory pathway component EscU
MQMKYPQLTLSADTVSRQLGDTSGDIEFSLRGRNITTKNFSLQMDKSADNRGDVKSSSMVITPPLNFFICVEFQP